MLVGVDVGGTFTDLVAWDGDQLTTAKVSTTSQPAQGAIQAVTSLHSEVERFIHGTTVATNALLERKGARTVLVGSDGFDDIIEIGRQNRPSLYDPMADRPHPLVARGDRGQLRPNLLEETIHAVEELDPEAVAVAMLYSFADDTSEQAIGAALSERLPGIPISLSSRVAPEFREYERTSTTVLNAYLSAAVGAYLANLSQRLAAQGVAKIGVMRSSGGTIDAARASQLPSSILLSGPAGGTVAAASLGTLLGLDRVISFDMGGTSTDVSRIDSGRPEVTYQRSIDGYPCRMPSVAVHTVGAGGGSIGWVDPGGALKAGPLSAGAHPGPASYGRGGLDPTVTDANLALGRLSSATTLADGLSLSGAAAAAALELNGLDPLAVAEGMVAVIEENMARAIRAVSVEEGVDPRQATLISFGGAGGLHATSLAKRLAMAGVVIPPHAGVFSALGLLLAPARADAARSLGVGEELDKAVEQVRGVAAAELGATTEVTEMSTTSLVDARYLGQSHEIAVPYEPGGGRNALEQRFHRLHHERNGFARPEDPVEVVTVRAEATQPAPLSWHDLPAIRPSGEASRGTRMIHTAQGDFDSDVWWRPGLTPGTEVVGPAIVEEPEATTYLGPRERGTVHSSGAIEVSW
ncbi:MAG: hydantoinase/oxoprolinase family protein [Acidimicrobiia bacterium]|nr:hydantoinase/oxoprolinase family protein [Acidimicrobiia bacterium]